MRLLFCVLAGRQFGYGHLNRCLSIADLAYKQGLDVVFLIIGEGADVVRKRGYTAYETAWPTILPAILFEGEQARSIGIVDVAHPSVFCQKSELVMLLQLLRKFCHRLVAIDSLGNYSFAVALPMIPVDVMVIPYVGATAIPSSEAAMLIGPEYALLSPNYWDLPIRQIKETADRVLVTFGGADPHALTTVALAALAQIEKKLVTRVVIGPLFPSQLIAKIESLASKLHHQVELVIAPDGLVNHMQWADIAVAASGLVKYELAATGTPSVLISIDEAHDQANRSFASERLQRDLGVTADPALICKAIDELLSNSNERRDMAERGQRLIDGRGAQRLLIAVSQMS